MICRVTDFQIPQGVELAAVRESLGLTGTALGRYLAWPQTRISEAEAGRRWLGRHHGQMIGQLVEWAEGMAEALYEQGRKDAAANPTSTVLIESFRSDKALHAAHPEWGQVGLAGPHRAAALAAMRRLAAEGIPARIVDAAGPDQVEGGR